MGFDELVGLVEKRDLSLLSPDGHVVTAARLEGPVAGVRRLHGSDDLIGVSLAARRTEQTDMQWQSIRRQFGVESDLVEEGDDGEAQHGRGRSAAYFVPWLATAAAPAAAASGSRYSAGLTGVKSSPSS